jgi:hypothetical protein
MVDVVPSSMFVVGPGLAKVTVGATQLIVKGLDVLLVLVCLLR